MKPFDPNAKLLGDVLVKSIDSRPNFVKKNILKILASVGIPNLEPDAWYDIEIMPKFYARIAQDFGPNTIFDLGKAIPDKAIFPPGIDSIESGLSSINVAYNMNHKDGYVGFYKMVSHDLEQKKIIMQCYNPYPCDFDRGLITAMGRKFESGVRVVVDQSKPNKKNGGHESWYIVTYH